MAVPPYDEARRVRDIAEILPTALAQQSVSTVYDIARIPYGKNNQVFDVITDAGAFIARTNADTTHMAFASHNLAALANVGLQVPKVYFNQVVTPSEETFHLVVTDRFAGTDLGQVIESMTLPEKLGVAVAVARQQRIVARMQAGNGYGYGGIGEQMAFRTWRAAILDDFRNRISRATPPQGSPIARNSREIDQSLHQKLQRKIEDVTLLIRDSPLLTAIRPKVYLHDTTMKNVIVNKTDGKYHFNGTVDHDVVGYGDIAVMWAQLQTNSVRDTPTEVEYPDLLLSALIGEGAVDKKAQDRARLYSAYISLEYLARNTLGKPPTFDRETYKRMWRHFDENFAYAAELSGDLGRRLLD